MQTSCFRLLIGVAVLIGASTIAAQEKPASPLDKIDARKLPAALRPKDLPKEVVAVLGDREGRVDTLAFRGDGKMIAIAGPNEGVHLWDLVNFKLTATLKHKEITALAFSPSGKILAAGDSQGNVKFWNATATGFSPGSTVAAHKDGPVWSVAFSSDRKWLASAGSDKMVKLWETGKAKPALGATLTGHAGKVRTLGFSPDGKWLASGGDDQTLRWWNLSADKPKEQVKLQFKGRVSTVAIAGDGKTLVVGSGEGLVRPYKIAEEKLEEMEPIALTKRGVTALQYAPEGQSILGLVPFDGNEDRVVIWDLQGKMLYESKFKLHIGAAAFAPDGRHIAALPESSAYIIRLPN